MSDDTPQVVIGIQNIKRDIEGISTSGDQLVRFPLPHSCSSTDMNTLKRDCDIFGELIAEHPEGMIELLDAMSRGDLRSAAELADAVGLTEEKFKEKGGGWVWLAAGLAVGMAIRFYSIEAY